LWGLAASVGDLDLTDLARLGEGACRIPTLGDVLADVDVDVPLMVDFTRREVVTGAVEVVRAGGAMTRALFVTGNVPALRRLREEAPEARLGLTWTEGDEPPLTLLAELDAEYWNPMHTVVTPAGVAAVHDAGRRVSAWTVDTADGMARLARAGVDAIVSNQVADLVRFVRQVSR
jgi:glycerophosphoryl diester phosphodiesterase